MRTSTRRPIATSLLLLGAMTLLTGCGESAQYLPAGMSSATTSQLGGVGAGSVLEDPVMAGYDGTDAVGSSALDDPFAQAVSDWNDGEGGMAAIDLDAGLGDEWGDDMLPAGYGAGYGDSFGLGSGFGYGAGLMAAGSDWGGAGMMDDGLMDAGFEDPDLGIADAGFDPGLDIGGAGFADAGFDAAAADIGTMDVGFDPGLDAGGFDPGFDAGGFDAGGFDTGGFDAGMMDVGFDAGIGF